MESEEANQERCEDSEKSSKAKNNRIANALIKNSLAVEEAALPHTAGSRRMVVLVGEVKWWALRHRSSHGY